MLQQCDGCVAPAGLPIPSVHNVHNGHQRRLARGHLTARLPRQWIQTGCRPGSVRSRSPARRSIRGQGSGLSSAPAFGLHFPQPWSPHGENGGVSGRHGRNENASHLRVPHEYGRRWFPHLRRRRPGSWSRAHSHCVQASARPTRMLECKTATGCPHALDRRAHLCTHSGRALVDAVQARRARLGSTLHARRVPEERHAARQVCLFVRCGGRRGGTAPGYCRRLWVRSHGERSVRSRGGQIGTALAPREPRVRNAPLRYDRRA